MYSPQDALTGVVRKSPASRRFALKAATETHHARVEGVVRSAGMFDSLDGYRRYLEASWLLRTRYETLLDASGAADLWPDWSSRRIAGLVAQDLADLGCPQPSPPPELPAGLPHGELLGVLYVLEGSSLGARLLVRSVAILGLTAGHGARHLHVQAGEPAAWRNFLDIIETSPEPPSHRTAQAVFDAFADAYMLAAS